MLKTSDKAKILKVLKEQRHAVNLGTKTGMTADFLGNSANKKAVEPHLYCSDGKTSSTSDFQCKYLSEMKMK